MYKRSFRIALIAVGSLVLITQYQNCAPEGAFEAASRSLDSVAATDQFLGLDHEDTYVKPVPISTFSSPLADRQIVEGILTNAFGPSFRSVNSVALHNRGPEFGKSCALYEEHYVSINGSRQLAPNVEACRTSSVNFIDTHATQGATPSRSAYMMRACSALVSNSTTFNYFMNQLGTKAERDNLETGAIIKAYSLFFIGKPAPSNTLISAIRFIGESQSDPTRAWSAIVYSLCTSEQWQVL